MRAASIAVFSGVIALAGATLALTPAPNTMTVDDLLDIEAAEGFVISPDGRQVAWAKTVADPGENGRVSHVYLSAIDGAATRQLTRGGKGESAPRFSPDGRRLAFLAKRGEKARTQVWMLSLDGGEARALTRWPMDVQDYAWIDDGSVLFAAREDSTLRERRLQAAKDDVVVVADAEHYGPVRLFRCDIESGETTRVTGNDGAVVELAVSPDGSYVVTRENQDVDYGYNHRNPPRQFLTDLRSGARREICAPRRQDPYDYKWTSDSRGFYCRLDISSDSSSTFVSINRLHYFSMEADSLAEVAVDWDRSLGRAYFPVEGGVIAALREGVRDRIVQLSGDVLAPRVRTVDNAKTVRLAGARSDLDRVVFFEGTASDVTEVISARLEGGRWKDRAKLTDLNESLKQRTLSRSEVIRWAGARGDSVEGVLYYPPQYEAGRSYPLIAWIHGGPSSRDWDFFIDRTSAYPHIMSARGAFILKVNYHGSDGYGLEWLESIKGHYYELEVPDILTGIDHVVEKGLADPERLGIMGWSNGSILAIACAMESDRFKVLCAGAGDVNWTSDYGNCAFGAAFDEAYFGGTPWGNTEAYIKKSPLFRMEKLTTPTLIMFGDRDTSVPTEQGWQHFRAMQQIGAAPVRFILFPGAGHGPRKRSHMRRKIVEELAWVDRYLFESYTPPNEALDPGSLLAWELERAKIARVGALFGVERDAVLVPEVVEIEGIAVSRFEITNAQFAAFDPTFTFPAGMDNHPVTGLSPSLAETYCLWLSERTGVQYRLPTPEEMEKLLKAAKPNRSRENTLNRWLGYTPTPEELETIRPKLDELERSRSLLEPVGSFRPVDGVYDLAGNAAEWVEGTDGKANIMGPSAVSVVDDRGRYQRPPLGYVGFRVVRR